MVPPAKFFFRIPDIFTFSFPLINLPQGQTLTLFSLQNRNAFGQEIVAPTAVTYMLLSAIRFYGVCLLIAA